MMQAQASQVHQEESIYVIMLGYYGGVAYS